MPPSPTAVIEHVVAAQNAHDVDGMLEWFDPDYRTQTPAHPERDFVGTDTVRDTWETVFRTTPDFEVTLLETVEDGGTVWAELRFSGTQVDGTPVDYRGVVIFGVADERLVRGRVYLEHAEAGEQTWQDRSELAAETEVGR
ncbi:nuclear transport factor 2 family protein [Halobacteriales archaeon Cl-PHB]